MSNRVENLDEKRRKLLKGYLASFSVFSVLWVVRFVLKSLGGLPRGSDLDRVFIVTLFLTIPFLAFYSLRLSSIRSVVRKDPELRNALYNELVIQNEMKAWRYGFWAMAAVLVALAVFSLFVPVRDIVALVITALWAGFGGYQFSFFILERG